MNMSSMAWDAIQMGIDPVMSPGGGTWEDKGQRPYQNRKGKNVSSDSKESGMTPEQAQVFAQMMSGTTSKQTEEEYKVGSTVRLKSGGALMTIKKLDEDILTCRWFNNNNDLNESEFSRNELYDCDNIEIDINEDEIPF